jgi:AraC-like DNA-binding protein
MDSITVERSPTRRSPPAGGPDAQTLLTELLDRHRAAEPNPHHGGLRPQAMARACSYIHGHISEHMSLAELAQIACVSRFHFARQFRVSTGLSPMAYITHIRIELAKWRLAQGDQPICRTALELGFFDQSHFTRTFRRATGQTPRDYVKARRHARTAGCALPSNARAVGSARLLTLAHS